MIEHQLVTDGLLFIISYSYTCLCLRMLFRHRAYITSNKNWIFIGMIQDMDMNKGQEPKLYSCIFNCLTVYPLNNNNYTTKY